jgi:hypothetical protein
MDMSNVQSWSNFSDIEPVMMDPTNNTEDHGPFDDVSFLMQRYEMAGANLLNSQQNHAWNNDDLDPYVDPDDPDAPIPPSPYQMDPVDLQNGIYRAAQYNAARANQSSNNDAAKMTVKEAPNDPSATPSPNEGAAPSAASTPDVS